MMFELMPRCPANEIWFRVEPSTAVIGGIRGGERSTSIITVPQSAIAEFQVLATGYSAEYGRSTGGVMNTITKSGTNDLHGEGFYQLRHRALSAKNPVVNVRPSETLQQFGGGIGGQCAGE